MTKYDTSGDYKLLNWRCIRNVAEEDNILVGKYGYISKYNEHKYICIFWSPRVAKKWDLEMVQGEEAGVITSLEGARNIRKDLKTFRNLEKQLEVFLKNGG